MPNGKEGFFFIFTEQGPASCVAHESGLLFVQINFIGAQTFPCIYTVCACFHTNRTGKTEALRLHRDEGNLPSALQSSGYLCPIKGIDSKQTDRGDKANKHSDSQLRKGQSFCILLLGKRPAGAQRV